MYIDTFSIKKSRLIATILFFLIFSYLKYPFIEGLKLHYFLPFLLIFLSFLFYRVRLQKELTFFAIFTLMFSSISYVILGILNHEDFNMVVFNNILFIANILLTFVITSTLSIDLLLKILYVNSLFYSIYTFIDITKYLMHFQIFRYTGTFKDPNYLALINIMFMAVSLYFMKEKSNKLVTLSSFFIVLINMVSILLTFSRSGYISLFVFVSSFLYLDSLRSMNIFIIPVFSLAIITISIPELLSNLMAFLEWRFLSESEIQGGLSRLKEIEAGFNFLLSKFPFSLLGMGYASSEVHSFFKDFYPLDSLIQPRIHNTYVAILIENGIMAFIVFIILLIKIFITINSNKQYRKYFLPLYLSALTSSLFIWNIYFLPFYISVFWIPFLIKKEKINRGG